MKKCLKASKELVVPKVGDRFISLVNDKSDSELKDIYSILRIDINIHYLDDERNFRELPFDCILVLA